MLDVKLKVASGKHQGQLIPLTTRRFLIGREQDCQLRTNSDLVSRHHCVFAVDDYAVRLRDLGSTNGTLVNGERVREVVLKAGDRVQIGKLSFEIVVTEKQVAEAPAAPVVAVESADGSEVRVESETVQLSADETQYELPSAAPAASETQYELPVPAADATGDTTIIQQQPGAPQQQLGWPPGYPPPPGMYPQWPPYGAPGQYYGYGQPYGAPGYPPQGQYPGYPPQYQQPAAPEPASAGQTAQATAPPIRLPPPENTGAQAAPPPAAAETKGDESKDPPAMNPSQRAAEIIKQRTRRG